MLDCSKPELQYQLGELKVKSIKLFLLILVVISYSPSSSCVESLEIAAAS